MTWNKCSEKLPEVGMLVVTRERIDKYDNDIESEDEYKERLLRSFSTDGFSYACNTVYAGKTGTLLYNISSGE